MGGRSAQVTGYLLQNGFDAVNMSGGLIPWRAAGCALTGRGRESAE